MLFEMCLDGSGVLPAKRTPFGECVVAIDRHPDDQRVERRSLGGRPDSSTAASTDFDSTPRVFSTATVITRRPSASGKTRAHRVSPLGMPDWRPCTSTPSMR